MTTAIEIGVAVRQFGADLVFDEQRLAIAGRSHVPDDLAAKVRARAGDIKALLSELLPASAHRYVLCATDANEAARTVCISCGCPPGLHGSDALSDPLLVERAEDAPLIAANAVVVAGIAETFVDREDGPR